MCAHDRHSHLLGFADDPFAEFRKGAFAILVWPGSTLKFVAKKYPVFMSVWTSTCTLVRSVGLTRG